MCRAFRQRILVVDDEPMVRESLRFLLAVDNHEIVEVSDAEQALAELETGDRFDCVFTDFYMPGIKGDQLARAIHSRNQRIPVVMVTGFPPRPVPEEVSFLMRKPFDLNTVRSILAEAVGA